MITYKLDQQEERLIDLAADGSLPRHKISARLNTIHRQRADLTERLGTVTEDLRAAAAFVETCLDLMANPHQLYAKASDDTRRKLNQAIFRRLYVYQDDVTGHELNPELQELAALNDREFARTREITAESGDQSKTRQSSRLSGSEQPADLSKTHMVEIQGLKPWTSAMPWQRSNQLSYIPSLYSGL